MNKSCRLVGRLGHRKKINDSWDFLPGGANKTTTVELIRADAERTAALEHVAVGGSLTHLEESYRGDPELVLTAVKANGSAFRYASDRLRSDRDFLLTAIERSCDVLCHVGDEWKCNRDFVLQAIGRAVSAPAFDL